MTQPAEEKEITLLEADYVQTCYDVRPGDTSGVGPYAEYQIRGDIEDMVPYGVVLASNGLHTWDLGRDKFGIELTVLPEGDPATFVALHLILRD